MPEQAHGNPHAYLGFLMLIPAGAIQLGIASVLDRLFIDERPRLAPQPAANGGKL